jgi:hypothetical protein
VIFHKHNANPSARVLQTSQHARSVTNVAFHYFIEQSPSQEANNSKKLPTFYETATVFLTTYLYISKQSILVDHITN